jgi:hypothetical protein
MTADAGNGSLSRWLTISPVAYGEYKTAGREARPFEGISVPKFRL